MKTICTLAIILLNSVVIFGQNAEQTNQIIVKLKTEIPDSSESLPTQKITGNDKIDSVLHKFHVVSIQKKSTGRRSNQSIYVMLFPQGTNMEQVMDELYKTGEIEYAEPDYKGSGGGIPNDAYYFRQWGLQNDGTFSLSTAIAGADIEMEKAWDIEKGDSNIVVAIIDGGVKFDHPEFTGRIWKNYNEIPNNGIDDDGNGYIDDVQGWDFANSDNYPMDDQGHGTNVTGIIGANGNNSTGYAGVDWNCKLMILKGLNNSNLGNYSWWAEALYYAVDNGAKVINMSVGGSSNSTTLQSAVNYAVNNGVTVVACMMNTNSGTVYYPAGFSGVIAVGSTDPDDTRSNPFFWSSTSGSNFGNHISVVAPGNYIYGLNYQSNTNYNTYWGGTSQATPHVTGLVSLLLAQNSSRTPAQIKSIIESTAEDQVGSPGEDIPGWDQYFGYGRINAFEALNLNPCYIVSNDSVAICNGDSLLLQGSYQKTAGTYYDTLVIVNSCDSVTASILTVNNSSVSSQTETACNSYLWNGINYTTSGTYTDTIPNVSGCDSIMTLDLTINTADTSVTSLANSLISNATAAAYQWLDCGNNYEEISGSNSQTYLPTVTGNYAVEVTQNGCTDTSSCYKVTLTGIENNASNVFSVYPNPANGLFTIEVQYQGQWNRIPYEITDVTGKLIADGILSDKRSTIDLSKNGNGIYLLTIDRKTIKLVKQ